MKLVEINAQTADYTQEIHKSQSLYIEADTCIASHPIG